MAEQASGSSDEPLASPLAAGWGLWLWWVLASTVGWAVGGSVGVEVGSFGDIIVAGYVGVAVGGIVGGPVGGFVGWAALGAVYGAVTGTVLVWLLRQRPPGSYQPSAVPNVSSNF